MSAGLFDAIKQACHERGFEPKIGQNAPQIVSILSLVSANLGVSLVPESTKQLQIQGVAYRSLKAPVPTVGLGLAYKNMPLHRWRLTLPVWCKWLVTTPTK